MFYKLIDVFQNICSVDCVVVSKGFDEKWHNDQLMNYCPIVDESPLRVCVCMCVMTGKLCFSEIFISLYMYFNKREWRPLNFLRIGVTIVHSMGVLKVLFITPPLKCRQLVLDSSTGKLKYQTKQFDVLPSELQQSRKYISCDSFNETICIQASSDCSPFRKQQKNDCTTRIRQNLFGSTLENTCIGLDPCLQEKSKNTLTFLKPPLVYYFWTALGLYCFRSC